MNCPIRTDPSPDEGHNQTPSDLAPEINTNNTLNHRRNSINGGARNSSIHLGDGSHDAIETSPARMEVDGVTQKLPQLGSHATMDRINEGQWTETKRTASPRESRLTKLFCMTGRKLKKYSTFIGPGFMVSVSYIDPGMAELTLEKDEVAYYGYQETMLRMLRLVRRIAFGSCS